MKRIMQSCGVAVALLISLSSAKGQGWNQDQNAIYSLGLGGTQAIFLPFQYYPLNRPGSVGLSLNVSGEYKVHRYISVGWQTGMDIFAAGYYYRTSPEGAYYNSAAVIGIPIGAKANFHILEATSAPIKDKLDVYAGINIGGGPAIFTGPEAGLYGFIYGGPQVGARYWFDNVAVFGELGWGATFANIGVTFR